MCDETHMENQTEMDMIRAALERAMERKGIKRKPLAAKAGLGETSVRDLLERGTDVRVGTLRKLADALDVQLEDLIGSRQVAVTGRVGAGGEVVFEDAGVLATVPRPPGAMGPLEAFEVIGDSMLPRYSSGDVVYVNRAVEGIMPDYIGEYCACRLQSGGTYIKLLARGSRPGYWTLRSLNAADIEDVELAWATPILFVLPHFSRRQLAG